MSKRIGTKGQHRQPQFDTFISNLKDDELSFLSSKYNRDLIYFINHNDLNNQESAQLYKEMQQRKKMIDEERKTRKMLKTSVDYMETRFDAESGTVVDSDNNSLGAIAYDKDEKKILNLPSGTQKEEEGWITTDGDDKNEDPDFDFETQHKFECNMSWDDWLKKKNLIRND